MTDDRANVDGGMKVFPMPDTRRDLVPAGTDNHGARLSPYKVPAVVEVRERLPRDANGKVLRASLDG
jgi:acyl-coenzyme A synthetase/AMP-(fatty) acid ligase